MSATGVSHSENRSASETRARLTEAAGQLFAERGFDHVSLRQITDAAEANIAAVNYHFGNKEGLIAEVMYAHLQPINELRMANLARLEREGNAGAKDLLKAFFDPLVAHLGENRNGGKLLLQFLARSPDQSGGSFPQLLRDELRKVIGAFASALSENVSHLTYQKAIWRIHFCFGCFTNTILRSDMLRQIGGEADGEQRMNEILEELLSFCAAGMENETGGQA